MFAIVSLDLKTGAVKWAHKALRAMGPVSGANGTIYGCSSGMSEGTRQAGAASNVCTALSLAR